MTSRDSRDSRVKLDQPVYNPHVDTSLPGDPFPYTMHSFSESRGASITTYGVAPLCNGPCNGKWLPEGALVFTDTDATGKLVYVAAYTDPLADPVHECGTRPAPSFEHNNLGGGKSKATHEYLAHIRNLAVQRLQEGQNG